MNVGHLVQSSGYLAVFGLLGAESLGVPLPGETALIAAGAYAGQIRHLSPSPSFASRSDNTEWAMPRSSRNSSNRCRPRKTSRKISILQRSPMISSV